VRSADDETISGSDVWAVGQDEDPGTGIDGLIENWNGSAWKISADLNIGGNGGSTLLNSVSGDSSANAWAVGESNFQTALIEHWNGTSWSVMTPPAQPSGDEDTLQ
jgi:hypothetical protein